MKHQDAPIGMGYLFNFNAKANLDKQFIGRRNEIRKCRTTDHRPGRLIGDAKQERSTALIGYGNAISRQLFTVITRLGLLELKTLSFGWGGPPNINLSSCCGHPLFYPFNGQLDALHDPVGFSEDLDDLLVVANVIP